MEERADLNHVELLLRFERGGNINEAEATFRAELEKFIERMRAQDHAWKASTPTDPVDAMDWMEQVKALIQRTGIEFDLIHNRITLIAKRFV
jgi:hypothetical protein